jgi:gamma-glutamylcyclotransferase (GGCT)/AIG2-like uncharacterized protein YtfP
VRIVESLVVKWYSRRMHVFTYGTLMFPEVWQVVGRSYESVEGTAAGFEVFRVCDAVFPGIIAGTGECSVPGVVYLDVHTESLDRLDRFEDDFYERRAISVDCSDGQRRVAEAYIVPPKHRSLLTNEPWGRESFVASGGLEQFISRFSGFGRVADGH